MFTKKQYYKLVKLLPSLSNQTPDEIRKPLPLTFKSNL